MSRQEAAPEDPPPAWRQRGGFSVLFEAGADGEAWQTRIYHEETGQEVVVAGLGEIRWPPWILDRLGVRERPVHEVAVEVAEVRLVDRTPRGDDTEVVRVEAELLVSGLAALERGLGAAVLRRAVDHPARISP
jgi:Tfp pilus assembly protein FimV